MDNSNKVLSDHISKVIDCIWTWANCECCGYYDDRTTNLDCWCQTRDWKEYKVWDLFRCPICSWDIECSQE